jgi:hypothetical protein
MKLARLILGALASLAVGAATGRIAPSRTRLPWVLGAIILAAFIPIHVQLWAKFPAWYHLVFLGPLVPLVALGARLTRSRNSAVEGRGGEGKHSWQQRSYGNRVVRDYFLVS